MFDDEDIEGSGLPMCRTTGEGQRQLGPKIFEGVNVSVANGY